MHIGVKQNGDVFETDGPQQPLQPATHRHPSVALVGGVFVLVTHRVIEFARLGSDEDVRINDFAVIDFRAGELQIRMTFGWDVLEQEIGLAFADNAVHRAQNDAVAMGIGELLVHPGSARQCRVIDFASR